MILTPIEYSIYAVAAVQKIQPTWHLIEALIPLFTILVMVVGIGFILATLDVFFRDTEYLWNVVTMLLMYLSAIFYDGEYFIANKRFGMLLKINPLYNIIANFRHAVYGEAMNINYMLYSMGVSIIVLILGVGLFYKKHLTLPHRDKYFPLLYTVYQNLLLVLTVARSFHRLLLCPL